MSARLRDYRTLGLALVCAGIGALGCAGSAAGPGGGSDDDGEGGSARGGSGSGGKGGRGGSPGTGGTVGPMEIVPGRVTIRRLNRAEYDNTTRDLLGLDLKPSGMFEFVEDEWGDGFNNDADVLSLSPLSIEKYLTAAQFLIDKALDPANAAARSRIMVCTVPMTAEAACGSRIVGDFAKRAFRRPVAAEELAPYLGLIALAKEKGDPFEAGLKLALAGLLVAPDFLFRAEIDAARSETRALNDYELASRLSYFIWASMPDDALFKSAEAGALTEPAEIAKQVARMLADPKAAGFTTAMVEQWMHTIGLSFAQPDKTIFPAWEMPVRAAMEQEVRSLVGPVLAGKAPADELLTANYTYANRALAKYYGLPGADAVPLDSFQKIMLTDTRRGGVLRGGSFLVETSHPDTHSPTRRGKWVLDRMLCSSPPPPPGVIPAFEPAKIATGTLRQKLEKVHVGMGGSCPTCHSFIDPIGFAFENYDGAGLWRTEDNKLPIDATGVLPDSDVKFNGAAELSAAIAKDARFPACIAKQVLTYGLGRKMGDVDDAAIADLGKRFGASGLKMPALVEMIAQSPLMTHRQAEKE